MILAREKREDILPGIREGSNVVVLDPDVAEIFRDQHLVNESLCALASIIKLREKEKV
jgi:hypothetical protein